MSGTARLTLPFLSAGQAQKEFFHNEALQTLDLVVGAAVEEGPRAAPPTSPVVGDSYIVGSSPTGDWAGRAQCLAGYTSGGWRFVSPIEGLSAYVKASAAWANYRSGAWEIGTLRGSTVVIGGQQVVGGRRAAIGDPASGAVVDTQARMAIAQMLAALRSHGLIDS